MLWLLQGAAAAWPCMLALQQLGQQQPTWLKHGLHAPGHCTLQDHRLQKWTTKDHQLQRSTPQHMPKAELQGMQCACLHRCAQGIYVAA